MIGFVQRNETNAMAQFVRADSTPNEPGYFITFSGFFDAPKILSYKSNRESFVLEDILYFLNSYNSDIWFYLFYCLILCTIIFCTIGKVINAETRSFYSKIRKVCEFFWDYFMLGIDLAPTSIGEGISNTVLWTSIVIAFFYAFHIILLSTLSTDLMILTIKPTIETLHDLLYDSSFNVTPMIIRNLNMYSVLSQASNGTDENILFSRLLNNDTGQIVVCDPNFENISLLMNVLKYIFDQVKIGYVALIENSHYFMLSSHMLCYIYPHVMDGIQLSSDTILPSALSLLVSKNTPMSAVQLFQHRVFAASEMDLLKGSALVYSQTLTYLGYFPNASIDGVICDEKVSNTYRNDLDLSWKQLSLEPFGKLFNICLITFFIALLSLLYEILHHTSENLLKRNHVKLSSKRGRN